MVGEIECEPATLLKPTAEDVLKAWPARRQMNSPRNNGAAFFGGDSVMVRDDAG